MVHDRRKQMRIQPDGFLAEMNGSRAAGGWQRFTGVTLPMPLDLLGLSDVNSAQSLPSLCHSFRFYV